MLHDFLTANRIPLINRCRAKVAARCGPEVTRVELEGGIALFLDQLIKTLQVEQTSEPMMSRKVSGPSGGGPALSEIAVTATRHGRELLRQGLTVDQVVHDYGDLCQSITDLAYETDAQIAVDEFRTLNRCLDNAIAGAVTEFGYQHDFLMADKSNQAWSERLGYLAHELRNQLQTATLAVRAIKVGNTGLSGATGAVLERSLIGLRTLIDRSLADVRAAAGMPVQNQLISVADLIADVKISASLEARSRQCGFTVAAVDPTLEVNVDRDMLCAAVFNLLQNAFKFTKHGTDVSLNAYATNDRILIDVADRCGGLPPGAAETMFQPFTQGGENKSGLGLGLSICRRSVEANGGVLRVRDGPGSGCIFTIDLPRHPLSKLAASALFLVDPFWYSKSRAPLYGRWAAIVARRLAISPSDSGGRLPRKPANGFRRFDPITSGRAGGWFSSYGFAFKLRSTRSHAARAAGLTSNQPGSSSVLARL